ncbi:UTP15 C terminal, partial [Bonamia ostreae]
KKLAIGCTNGLVTVLKSKKEKIQKKRKIIVDENVKTTILEKPKFRKLAKYDKDLKFFRYKEAVDNLIIKNNPSAAMASSLFRELIERNALKLALSNRKDENLAKILKFLIKNLFRPQFSVVFLNVAWQILEIYSEQVFLFSESKWL